jgi:prolyl-tRNA synthetase
MKDLYTFDYSSNLALVTYDQVREAYTRLFDELKLPYLVAEADSGNMGGNLSHEFHFPTSKGEDHIISCNSCKYVANEELAETRILREDGLPLRQDHELVRSEHIKVWHGISQDRSTLINVWYSSNPNTKLLSKKAPEVNIHAIKKLIPELDTAIDIGALDTTSLESAGQFQALTFPAPRQITNLVDHRITHLFQSSVDSAGLSSLQWPHALGKFPIDTVSVYIYQDMTTGDSLNLLRIQAGDHCPRCETGVLDVQKAIELGHTFHLGTRYSEPLMAQVALPPGSVNQRQLKCSEPGNGRILNHQGYMHMGCHGIGVSRMIGAVADTLADRKGLNWPRAMAPFEVVVIGSKGNNDTAAEVYDILSSGSELSRSLPLDLILDDREASFPWKMQDADLVGYPVIVVVGRGWKAGRTCEVQCRRLKIRQEVPIGELFGVVNSLLVQL